MVPNIYFWRNGGDYFQLTASIVPLLHTWSLGVEEQFYPTPHHSPPFGRRP
jgi:peptidoglycan/LPS O-acetylase OafA/YrhL